MKASRFNVLHNFNHPQSSSSSNDIHFKSFWNSTSANLHFKPEHFLFHSPHFLKKLLPYRFYIPESSILLLFARLISPGACCSYNMKMLFHLHHLHARLCEMVLACSPPFSFRFSSGEKKSQQTENEEKIMDILVEPPAPPSQKPGQPMIRISAHVKWHILW